MTLTRAKMRWTGRASLVLGVAMLAGCATTQNKDPLESLNRKVYGFNEALDAVLIKPVAVGYATVTPSPVQTGVANFINNIKDVWSAFNLFLQGRPGEGAKEVLRVGVNSTLGLAGFVDVATDMRLDRHNEDLGQTLGVWGAPDGAYLVLPFFGPSTVRDAIALPADQYFMPSSTLQESRDANGMRFLQVVSARAQALRATDLLDDVALDKYAFVRDAYLQRRRNMIYNGEPPDEQSLWAPEVAPLAVLWHNPIHLDLSAPLDRVLAGAGQGQLAALCTAQVARDLGVVASMHPVPMGESAPAVVSPTAEELAGLRADDAAR
jgi:phospholipid-binding lipoprotein MlaA